MACTLAEVQTDACTSGIGKVVDQTQLLQLIAQLYADIVFDATGLAVTPDAILARACTSGIGKVQDELTLLRIIGQLGCDQVS